MDTKLLSTKGMRAILLITLLFSGVITRAQEVKSKNTIPPFNILLTNAKYLKAAELKNDAFKMIIYFDPTCDHCKNFTEQLLKHENELLKTQIIMISYTSLPAIKKFETDFDLAKYSNIKVGTEGYTFVVQRYYNIQRFPFIALFNKKGELIKSYTEAPSMDILLNTLKNGQTQGLHQ